MGYNNLIIFGVTHENIHIFMLGIALSEVQHLAPGLIQLHEILMGPYQVCSGPLDAILSFCCVTCTVQLHNICRLAEGALVLIVYVISKDI